VIGPIKSGIGVAARRLGPATWVYLVSLISTLPAALAIAWLADRHLGASPAGDAALGGLSIGMIVELWATQRASLEPLVPLALGASILTVALSAFFDGAVIAAAAAEGPLRTGDFYAGGGRVLGRMLRLLTFNVPFVLGAAGGSAFGLSKAFGAITKDWIDEPAVFFTGAAGVALWLILIAWIKGASDLMKVEAVAKGEHRARWAFARGLGRAVRHPLQLLLANVPFLGLALAITLGSLVVDRGLDRSADEGIVLGLLLQQGTAFVRAVLEVGLMGAMVALVRGDRPR
jgi:hypothetical protein